MAKKQSISYGPDTALIRGEADVARSQGMLSSAGGTAFAQGLTGAVISGIQEQEKRNSIRDAYMADLGGIQNINLLDEDYNKQAVTNFVRGKRDEYAKLADAYARTKDTDILDKMESIKFSFSNLNNQLQGLTGERKAYLDAYDKGQIVDIPELGDNIYTSAYTNKGQFMVDDSGNIGFNIDGATTQFKDIAGKYNVKSNIGEAFSLKQNINAKKLGEGGRNFYRDDTKNAYISTFKQTGPEGIMVMAKTDLTGDNDYFIGEGDNRRKAGNLSFESMWSQGILDDKFYSQIPKGTSSKWMYDKKNINILNDLMSEYYTDVTEFSYNQGRDFYNATQQQRQDRRAANFIIGGQTFNAQDFNNSFVPFINKLQTPSEGETFASPTGMKFKYQNGKYYVYNVNTKEIDKSSAMSFNELAVADGWSNFLTETSGEDPLNPNN